MDANRRSFIRSLAAPVCGLIALPTLPVRFALKSKLETSLFRNVGYEADFLRVVTMTDLESLPVGAYSLGKWRIWTARELVMPPHPEDCRWVNVKDCPQELIARVMDASKGMPEGGEEGTHTRADGKRVYTAWIITEGKLLDYIADESHT